MIQPRFSARQGLPRSRQPSRHWKRHHIIVIVFLISWCYLNIGTDLRSLTTIKNKIHDEPEKYIQLPFPNSTLPPVSMGCCCGIGHRMTVNIISMVYAISHYRLVFANWENNDVVWNDVFNNTTNIMQGPTAAEHYGNELPLNWDNSSLARTHVFGDHVLGTAYQYYHPESKKLFEMPLAQSIVKSLADNLSPLVLSFLEPLREQYVKSDLHLCVHVREGNNETGDWAGKAWRHIDVNSTLDKTLISMENFTATREGVKTVSVFVASDTEKARCWFEKNAPATWRIVKPGKVIPRPETGVWFGEHGSPTNSILSAEQKREAFAEGAADVFALGECHALFIPNYSSFSVIGIILTRGERNKVFFINSGGNFTEYPWIK